MKKKKPEPPPPEPDMTDEELQEMVYLFRLVRNGNDRPGEAARCRELLRRFDEQKKRKEAHQ